MTAARTTARIVLALLLPHWVAGCVAPGRLATPSGRPEVFVEGATLEEAAGACIQYLAQIGAEIEKTSNFQVQGVKRETGFAAAFFSTGYDSDVWCRAVFSLAKLQGGVKIYASEYVVSNRGSAFERLTPLNQQKHYNAMQNALVGIRANISSAKGGAKDTEQVPLH